MGGSLRRVPVVVLIAAATVVGSNVSTASGQADPHLAPDIAASAHSVPTANLPAGVPKHGRSAFLLLLSTPSTGATYDAAKTRGSAAAKSAARAQLHATRVAQDAVVADLPSGTSVLYRAHAAANAVAVYADVKHYSALRAIRGVSGVYPIAPKKPNLSYSVPLQRAPQGWQAYGDLGAHVRIAVIDSGVDYTHANFGGPGTVAAYQTAFAHDRQKVKPGSYDPDKFDPSIGADGTPAGMYDFAGDHYDPNPQDPTYQPVPHPDPNPLGCDPHGSHVAGIAAGYGEYANGSTYTGPYNTSTPFSTMRIGPGMAPMARIYAYKVFGCVGSTNVTGAAIDKAMDPNGDGDTSDHVDVINMSLGSDYGSPQDGDAVLTNLASKLGVLVATSSGNGGDLYDITGSPGSAVRAITAANSTDAYQRVDTLHVSAPAAIAGSYPAQRSVAYDYASGPDLSGTVVRVSQPGNLDGCAPLNAADTAAVDGHIAFVEWTDDNDQRRCGSVARSSILAAAGATGFIFANDSEMFTASITGSTEIPGVELGQSGADPMREQLLAGATVTVSGTSANDFKEIDPAYNDTMINTGSSRGLGDYGNVKPDVAAVGTSVFSTGLGTGDEGLNDSGTSMASPMVAGEAALVRSMHPDWNPEQVKADIMNTADADVYLGLNHTGAKYAPQRVGSGRIDVKAALDNHVLAYDAAGLGSVSSSFGPIAVVANAGTTTRTRMIKVQNTGETLVHYDVSYQARTRIPGVTYSVSPSSVRINARSSALVTVKLTIDPSQLTKTLDPTMRRIEQGLLRQYQADASGLVIFSNTDSSLRVPVYAAPRPASAMTQPDTISMPGGVSKMVLPLQGVPVNQGSGASAVVSKVAGFELQAHSGVAPNCSASVTTGCVSFPDERMADLKYVGITSDAPQLRSIGRNPSTSGLAYFEVTTQGRFRTAVGTQTYEVWIDGDGDGVADSVLISARIPAATTGSDVLIDELIDLSTGAVVDAEPLNDSFGDTDTAIFDSDSIVMPVAIAAIPGLTSEHSRIQYAVEAYSGYENTPLDTVGQVNENTGELTHPLSFDVLHPGIAVYGSYFGHGSALLYRDAPGTVLAVRRDTAQYRKDHGLGVLILHFHNLIGHKAQVVHFAT